jgi:hypothetical protein
MASGNPDLSGGPGGKREDAARIAVAMEAAEMGKRITALEETVRDLDKSLTERHTQQITRIFQVTSGLIALSAILVTVPGVLS